MWLPSALYEMHFGLAETIEVIVSVQLSQSLCCGFSPSQILIIESHVISVTAVPHGEKNRFRFDLF